MEEIGPGPILYIVIYAVCHCGHNHVTSLPAGRPSHWQAAAAYRRTHWQAPSLPSVWPGRQSLRLPLAVCFSDLELLGAIVIMTCRTVSS